MTSDNELRLGGGALALGTALVAVGWVLGYAQGTEGSTIAWLHYVGHTLLLFGFIGLYGSLREELGSLGLWGFILATIGNATIIGMILGGESLALDAAVVGPLGNFGIAIGVLLLCAAMWTAESFSPVLIGTLALGAVIMPFGVNMTMAQGSMHILAVIGILLIAVGSVPIGTKIWMGEQETVSAQTT